MWALMPRGHCLWTKRGSLDDVTWSRSPHLPRGSSLPLTISSSAVCLFLWAIDSSYREFAHHADRYVFAARSPSLRHPGFAIRSASHPLKAAFTVGLPEGGDLSFFCGAYSILGQGFVRIATRRRRILCDRPALPGSSSSTTPALREEAGTTRHWWSCMATPGTAVRFSSCALRVPLIARVDDVFP